MGDAAEPRCQAWGGPRASNNRWSNEAGSIVAKDHRKGWTAEIGGATVGDAGATSVPARLMLAQTAQKISAGPVGFLLGAECEASMEEASMFAAIAKGSETPPDFPR